jgi:hypothetical protein
MSQGTPHYLDAEQLKKGEEQLKPDDRMILEPKEVE